jgi:hypothetical protein
MAIAFANIWSTPYKVAFTAINTAGGADTGSILSAALIAAAPANSPIRTLLTITRADQAAARAAVGRDVATNAQLRGCIKSLLRTSTVAGDPDTTVDANVAAPNSPIQLDVTMAQDGTAIIVVEATHTVGR